MRRRTRRGGLVLGGVLATVTATALVLGALRGNLVFFYTPTQVLAQEAPRDRHFRVGGVVEPGSVQRDASSLTVQFVITDLAQGVPVRYTGLLPDLFREGEGVVAQGRLDAQGLFQASQVLAKHDENYMPPEAAHALRAAQGPDTPAGASVAGGGTR